MSDDEARAWAEGYNQAVRDHRMREDGEPYCEWPTSPNPYREEPTP